jgi:hypothetical protein
VTPLPLPDGFPVDKTEQANKGRRGSICDRTGEPNYQCKCPSCIGRRNRRKGSRKQRGAGKAVGVPPAKFGSQKAHEENWRGPVRLEVKAGRQVQRTATVFLAAEAQSETARAVGDPRPFAMVAMPDGWGESEGLVVVRLSDFQRVAEAWLS